MSNWYKKSQASKSIAQAQIWVRQYAGTHGGKKCLIHGQCDTFAEDFSNFVGDSSAEIWSLWDIYDEWHDKLSYMNSDWHQTQGIIGKRNSLGDIGSETHIVVKWNGYWWDGYGAQSLDDIMTHFNKIQNPHWFRI